MQRDLAMAVQKAEAARETTTCDPDADGSCDGTDGALQLIADNPASEEGYRALLNQSLADTQYRSAGQVFAEAKDAFLGFERRYPASVWPRKMLAELYHEYMSHDDTALFQRSYDAMAKLRRLPAYRELMSDTTNYLRFEADFAEITLSARLYDETDSIARHLVTLTRRPVYRLNMALFMYMGAVMRRDRPSAETRLAQLADVIKTLPQDFYNGWMYPGTIEFIERSDLPRDLRTALLKLCKDEYWYVPREAMEIVEQNRSALKVLPSTPKA